MHAFLGTQHFLFKPVHSVLVCSLVVRLVSSADIDSYPVLLLAHAPRVLARAFCSTRQKNSNF